MQSMHTEIVEEIKRDVDPAGEALFVFSRIQAKRGIHVYRCVYEGKPAVAKYFEREEDRREILNHQILLERGIPTIPLFALGQKTLVMEDISQSKVWRLGLLEDLRDEDVADALARWYFELHEKGAAYPNLFALYFEYDRITQQNIALLQAQLPEAGKTLKYIAAHIQKLRAWIARPRCTLTYNDFYFTNMAVGRENACAMMFDYNLLGRGYRSSDLRNVRSSLSPAAARAFEQRYARLYIEKHGVHRQAEERAETAVDRVAGPLFSLMVAFDRPEFPEWAADVREQAADGALLAAAKELLG